MKISQSDTAVIHSAVQDAIFYNLSTKEGLMYVQNKLGRPISERAYFTAKKKILDNGAEDTAKEALWLDQAARVGFVRIHKRCMDHIEEMLNHDWHLFLIQKSKPLEEQEANLSNIIKLKDSIAEHLKLYSDMSHAAPIVAQIKAMISEANKVNNTSFQNAK